MCEWLIDKSPLQLWWVECFQLVYPKWIVVMQQVSVILIKEHDYEWCACISQKRDQSH
jgi:hypothetical protein